LTYIALENSNSDKVVLGAKWVTGPAKSFG